MPQGEPVVWTRAMDDLVRRSTIRVAAARLGLARPTVVARRGALRAAGVTPASTGKRGRPAGLLAPGAESLEVIRLFGQGRALADVARLRGTSRQTVHVVLNKYVFGTVDGRRWCCVCLKPFEPKLAR